MAVLTARDVALSLAGLAPTRWMPPAFIEALATISRMRSMRTRTRIYRAGSKGIEFWIVLEGAIRAEIVTPRGIPRLMSVLGPGQFVGLASVLDAGPMMAHLDAEKGAVLLVIPKREFLAMLSAAPWHWPVVARMLGERVLFTVQAMAHATYAPLHRRLGWVLLAYADAAEHLGSGAKRLRLTQADVADILGTTRSRANQALKSLAEEGIVDLSYGTIVVRKPDRLLPALPVPNHL